MNTIKVYEKEHPFTLTYFSVLLSVIIILCVLFVDNTLRSGVEFWLAILAIVFSAPVALAALFQLLMMIKRYVDLCIFKKPVAVIKDDALSVYSEFGKKYKRIEWRDVSSFNTLSAIENAIQPQYKDEAKAKSHSFFFVHRDDYIVTEYLDIEEQQFLNLLEKHVK
ncbi:MAG: hypothetical protein K6E54_10480 [Bacteroidaceae bacterium]|nr:hypothetical protein [Bacteroidaceae bacterium]